MTESDNEPSNLAHAYGWVVRMTTVILEMMLPGLGGQWLDSRLGTNYWALAGFILGFVIGISHLIQMVKRSAPANSPNNDRPKQNNP